MKILVFFKSSKCGYSRRMDSLVDHFIRTHRDYLKLAKVDIDERPDLARKFNVDDAPTRLLLDNLTESVRLTGKQTLPQIKGVIEPLLIDEMAVTEAPQQTLATAY